MSNTRLNSMKSLEDSNYPVSQVRDYFTLLKPRVMYLVIFTALVGILLAPAKVKLFEVFTNLFAIALGSGAAGAFNMWHERDLDAKMERTKNRPLPRGVVCESDCLIFSITCGIISLMILFLSSNITATLLLACAMLIYGWIYTIYLKRTSSQNIVIGGLAGALPPLIGWASVTNSIDFEPVILVAIIFLWTPPHFWALSIKKQSEYEAAGIPMLPNVKGITHTKLNILIYSIILIFSSFLPYYYSFATSIYCIIAILLGSRFIYLAVMLYTDPESKPAMQLFGFSIFYLFALFATLLIGKLLSI
jgi:protoheme IX farnesyltransferase